MIQVLITLNILLQIISSYAQAQTMFSMVKLKTLSIQIQRLDSSQPELKNA